MATSVIRVFVELVLWLPNASQLPPVPGWLASECRMTLIRTSYLLLPPLCCQSLPKPVSGLTVPALRLPQMGSLELSKGLHVPPIHKI